MESHTLGEIDRLYKEALTWSKETLHLLQKPYGSLESVNLNSQFEQIEQAGGC